MYRVVVERSAEKDLRRLPFRVRSRVADVLRSLANDPRPAGCRKLSGTKHDWRRELFETLKKRQRDDGSYINKTDKQFGEADPNLATAFALLALSYTKPPKN